jgi:hypothetical protein
LQGQAAHNYQNEYAEELDTSTVLAILSDFDLNDATELASARQILDLLKATSTTEQDSGFDPSGASGAEFQQGLLHNAKDENESVSAKSLQGWRSQTDDTSLSQDMGSLDLEGSEYSEHAFIGRRENPGSTYTSELDSLDEEGKEKTLIGIFPALRPFDVKWTLKRYKGDVSLAIDELMTQSFLEESGSRQRGIEAFSANAVSSQSRKGKGKGKKKRGIRLEEHANSPTKDDIPESKWDMARKDVEFISEKTGMPLQQVTTMYHQNGASLHDVISAIISAHMSMNLEVDDPMVQINAFELRQDFPTLQPSDLESLIQITHPSLSNARDLAEAFVSRPATKNGGVQLSFRHAPIDVASSKSKPAAHNAVYPDLPLDASAAARVAASHRHTRDNAFVQASTAYRKGKSDHLMGGAAAYYSQVARDADARLKVSESQAADALVNSQSSSTQLDLHGVSVKDALRITSDRVEAWWFGLGEDRLIGGRSVDPGYRIVTGIGRHSEGGRSKLGPAVGKMLVREGWKVEVGPGHLVVRGKARI